MKNGRLEPPAPAAALTVAPGHHPVILRGSRWGKSALGAGQGGDQIGERFDVAQVGDLGRRMKVAAGTGESQDRGAAGQERNAVVGAAGRPELDGDAAPPRKIEHVTGAAAPSRRLERTAGGAARSARIERRA